MSIASELTRIQNAKNSISSAITNKGVTVPTGTKLDGMASLIGQIETGGGGEIISGLISASAEGVTVHFTDENGYHRNDTSYQSITCLKDSLIFIENCSSYQYGINMTGAEIVYTHTYEKWIEIIEDYVIRADILVRVKDNGFTIYP